MTARPADEPTRLAEPQAARDPGDEAYLAALGEALRRARTVRGMSRKVLAQVSGVSERYIAQAESGRGNLSVLVLRRIARATGAALEDLITADAPPPSAWGLLRELVRTADPVRLAKARAALSGEAIDADNAMQARAQRVALIGLRGAGKSTLGRLLAERLGWSFVELNREIERAAGFSINEIFSLYGQEGYRRLEQTALRGVAARSGPLVLATGGGIVAEPLTYDLLAATFRVVWIKASAEEHMERVRAQGDLRPMANDRSAMTELVAILRSREPLYARAEAIVNTTGQKVEQSLARLVEAVEQGPSQGPAQK